MILRAIDIFEFPPRIIFIIRGIFKPKQTKRKVKPFKTKVQ